MALSSIIVVLSNGPTASANLSIGIQEARRLVLFLDLCQAKSKPQHKLDLVPQEARAPECSQRACSA